ncbi:tRNA-dihydrouridine synthase [Gryllus bimaculatus]|nr:tRNA-dihydrouridine synthase [Gryllus bimaculatus]
MSNQVMELLESNNLVKVCAPMVRYSKLPFRTLVRKYNCDICFTPMIIADSFVMSQSARNNEFCTSAGDRPLIVQFAANNPEDFSCAAEMVAPQSVELCQQLESAGVSFITIHGRTPAQRHQPINIVALQTIRASVQLPLIANGDVKTLQDAEELQKKTKCEGVMAARGILTNPALFAGFCVTPLDCVAQWVVMGQKLETNFQIFHHHLSFMLEKIMRKRERVLFNSLKNITDTKNFLEEYFNLDFSQTVCSLTAVEECNYENVTNDFRRKNVEIMDSFEDFLENSCLYVD